MMVGYPEADMEPQLANVLAEEKDHVIGGGRGKS
jgi:hypothetical protein